MASSYRGAGFVLGGLPERGTEAVLVEYVKAGIRAFLFPGVFLIEPDRLKALVAMARSLAEGESSDGDGKVLAAIGGWSRADASLPLLPDLPSPLALAAIGDRRSAQRTGFLLGSLAASCGIDLVFAPCLDLATDPKSPGGILDRFGEEAGLAGVLGSSYASGLARGGVAACAGRFPGCGSLVSDGRAGPRILPSTRERLEAAELQPFGRAIKAGLAAVLVARVYAPAFEEGRIPAARSDRVIEGELRSVLGFHGLVIGDALDARGEADPEGPERAALLGALAGCDLSIALEPGAAIKAAGALDRAGADGSLPEPRMAVSKKRILALLSALPSAPRGSGPVSLAALISSHATREAERAATILKQPAAQRRAVCLAEASEGLFVLVFLPPPDSPDIAAIPAVLEALKVELPGARILTCPALPQLKDARRVTDALGEGLATNSGAALVFSYDAHSRPSQESLIHVVEESGRPVSVIAFRDPL